MKYCKYCLGSKKFGMAFCDDILQFSTYLTLTSCFSTRKATDVRVQICRRTGDAWKTAQGSRILMQNEIGMMRKF